jgi:Caenorhabditis protein of unknown function, DUF268
MLFWRDSLVSTLEHIGLPAYGLAHFPRGDERAMTEVARLLKAGAPAIVTVPAGHSKITSQYRQYSPGDLGRLLASWHWRARYWGFDGRVYVPITEAEVELYDYRDGRAIARRTERRRLRDVSYWKPLSIQMGASLWATSSRA